MCGIAGIVALDGEPRVGAEQIARMCACIEHRGPDDSAVDVRDNVGLGMQRLSIIDVEGGRQPIFNEDRSVRTVYNGEIYNFRELRRELEGRGHRFATAADTEVIVHAWEDLGADFAARLSGMFAIALHDRRRRRFLLLRDRLGIKPLYWAVAGGCLVFGSEIKALLASGLIEPQLNIDAVPQFLAWEYVPGPATLFAGIQKLEPGSLLELDLEAAAAGGGVPAPRTWWDLPGTSGARGGGTAATAGGAGYGAATAAARRPVALGVPPPLDGAAGGDAPRTAGDWADAVDTTLRACVQRHLVADVPLGAFLSGGVDSSLMVAGMGPARTFSIGFDEPSYDELGWARKVAGHLGVDHQDEIIRPDVVELFDHLMQFMDDPIGDFSIFPTYLVSRLARRHVKVALSGDGGDELFGGYETYVAQGLARKWARIPAALRAAVVHPLLRALGPRPAKKGWVNMARRFVEGFEHDPALGHARWRLFAGPQALARLLTPEARAACSTPVGAHIVALSRRAGDRGELDRSLYVDLKSYLCDNILVKVDRMSMACSLEARVPYLDPELVELAFRVPAELKVSGRRTKVLLKRVAARHLPGECVYRPKQGFSIPIKRWLGGEFRPLMEELLAPARLAAGGLFDPAEVGRLKTEHLTGRENHSHVLWALLVFQDWRARWGA
jgi:asparagine synthase (glutamine-hydrolysing)